MLFYFNFNLLFRKKDQETVNSGLSRNPVLNYFLFLYLCMNLLLLFVI